MTVLFSIVVLSSLVISSGAAKITAARSVSMPAGMIAGAPFAGPSWLEPVMKRRSRSLSIGRGHPIGIVAIHCFRNGDI
jgi:hypothetical protein